jgi:predicted cation transporter
MVNLEMTAIPSEPVWWMVAGLVILTLLVLILPFRFKWCERNLELFFLVVGILAVTISRQWSGDLLLRALKAPVMIGAFPVGIFQVVLVFGLLIHYFHQPFYRAINILVNKLSLRVFVFIFIVFLSLISSIVSVIVTSVVLVEIAAALPLKRKERINLVIVACFAVGLGAVLTPLGEPMSTILVQKLTGPPFYADFLWPIKHFAIYVLPATVILGLGAAIWIGIKPRTKFPSQIVETYSIPEALGPVSSQEIVAGEYSETVRTVIIRAVKVFAFVAALVFLGEGLHPLIIWFLMKVPAVGLFWINMISAVLDNATLTAVEVSVNLSLSQIISVVISLLIAGGMLIPGNIPNIVAAGRLKISMKEWAILGIPLGLVIFIIYFVILFITGIF